MSFCVSILKKLKTEKKKRHVKQQRNRECASGCEHKNTEGTIYWAQIIYWVGGGCGEKCGKKESVADQFVVKYTTDDEVCLSPKKNLWSDYSREEWGDDMTQAMTSNDLYWVE